MLPTIVTGFIPDVSRLINIHTITSSKADKPVKLMTSIFRVLGIAIHVGQLKLIISLFWSYLP